MTKCQNITIMSKKLLHFLAPPKPSTILFSALLLITGVIGAQERIGVAAAVDTTTTDLTLEQERKLVDEGYKIIQNHTIETDEKGKAQMLLIDGTAFTVGPNSSVTLDSFIYNPETAEGSLSVTSKGLMRLVGGKVTKKNPAIIRTNSATVGIRGGIVFVDSQDETTEASFIYGDEMSVTPNLNQDGTYVLTRNGFVVVVDDPLEEVEDVSLLTADQLLAMQQSLQGSPEEEEESEEESSEEGESEEESEEEESEEEEKKKSQKKNQKKKNQKKKNQKKKNQKKKNQKKNQKKSPKKNQVKRNRKKNQMRKNPAKKNLVTKNLVTKNLKKNPAMKLAMKKALKILDLKIVAEKNQIAVTNQAKIQLQKMIHQMPQAKKPQAKKHPMRAANQILQAARVKVQRVQKQQVHQMMPVQPKQTPLLEKQIQQLIPKLWIPLLILIQNQKSMKAPLIPAVFRIIHPR